MKDVGNTPPAYGTVEYFKDKLSNLRWKTKEQQLVMCLEVIMEGDDPSEEGRQISDIRALMQAYKDC